MSKSIGNVILAKDFFKKEGADVLRFIFLTTSYSAPINLNSVLIDQAKNQIDKLSKAFIKAQIAGAEKIKLEKEALLISE